LTEFDADVVVVGAGIVGLTAARAVQRRRGGQVLVLDKADHPAAHQTGRNSGVVHSGLYYRPGSAKATLVADGRARLERYCHERSLPYDRCGKVVVATSADELPALGELARRGAANGVAVERIGPAQLHHVEPHVRGLAALSVPSTAITDYRAVASSIADDLVADGGALHTGVEVRSIDPLPGGGVALGHTTGRVRARWLLNCAGLHSDRVATMAGADTGVSIVPFRGEYHQLSPSARHLVRHLVYPVPDPRWPFLGVHMTRMVDGSVHVGPNAVLALGREAYEGGVDGRDVLALARDPGLRRLAARYWRTGAAELLRSRSERLLLGDVRRLLPEATSTDLRPAGAGIRAQALGRDGTLLDDFAFATSPHGVHVLNAPSPAATASFAIAEVIADRLDRLVGAG
jgi:L-2-hydroxyglutarate oxidase